TVAKPLAAGGVDGFIDRIDHLHDLDISHLPRELIAAAGPANACHQAATAQLGKQLLKVGKRNALAFGNVRKGDRTLLRMERQVEHRGHGVTAFGSHSHRFAPSIMVWRKYAIPECLDQL